MKQQFMKTAFFDFDGVIVDAKTSLRYLLE